MMDINNVIAIIRHLKEENGAAPTVNLGAGQIAGTKEAGDDPPVDLRSRNTKKWNIFFKGLVRQNRKKKKKGK